MNPGLEKLMSHAIQHLELSPRPDYMARLREINKLRRWGIQFDDEGRMVPILEKMRDILHILLDHRLRSELSDNCRVPDD